MSKTFRITLYSIIALGIVVLSATIVANIILKNKLENFILKELPNTMISSYDELSVHTLDGSVLIKNPKLIIQNKEDAEKHTFIDAEILIISDVSYWNYIFKKEIHIGKISLENPVVTYYKDRAITVKDTIESEINMERPIFVDRLIIDNTKLTIYEKSEDSTKLYTQGLSVEIGGIIVNKESINHRIPLEYKTLEAKGDTIFVKANPYENLTVARFSIKDRNFSLNNLNYKTKYSKALLSQIIEVERDHYDLSIASLSIQDFDFGFEKDRVFFAKSNQISLDTPNLVIYRDKLIADDTSIKPLYSRTLRELPFLLTVDSVKIKDGFLKYEERVKEENSGGQIQFKNLNANISNVSNTYTEPEKTDIKIKALFMDKTPIAVDWSFDVQDPYDQFVFKADIGHLEAERMNSFTEPNLKVQLQGQANKTYFTIDGNNENSKTDLKINYSDFKVTVLQKDGKKKNKFLSTVVNIFVSKNSEKKEDSYREGTGEATRNKTKSVFNLLWISVKSALEKTMI